jgi:3-methyladenine DNA glycosylase AlkD
MLPKSARNLIAECEKFIANTNKKPFCTPEIRKKLRQVMFSGIRKTKALYAFLDKLEKLKSQGKLDRPLSIKQFNSVAALCKRGGLEMEGGGKKA